MVWTSTPNGYGILRDGAFVPPEPGNRDWDQFQEFLALGGTPQVALADSLAVVKARAKAEVSDDANALVAQETPLSADAYQRLLEHGEAQAADGSADPLAAEDYPLLAAQVGVLGPDLAAVVAAVLIRHAATVSRIAAIAAERGRAHAQIEAQSTASGVASAVAAIVWPAAPAAPANNSPSPT